MSMSPSFPAWLGKGDHARLGRRVEALQHGDTLPRSCSGEATCLLGSLASDFAFLQMSYCLLAPSHVVELHSEGFTLAVPSPSLPRYVWYFFWATCSAVLSSAFVLQAQSLAKPQHGLCLIPLLENDIGLVIGSCASSSAWSHQAPALVAPALQRVQRHF